MCDICKQTPCIGRCPNAPDAPVVYTCDICGESIFAGDYFYEMDGIQYHENCFEDDAIKILINECGAFKSVAKEEGKW